MSGRMKQWILRYERHISSAALLIGFVIDNLTLRRVDLLAENLVILGYLFVAGFSIFILNSVAGGVLRGRFFLFLESWMAVLLQFAFGGLFSSFTVFYLRSSSFAGSWFFILFLASLLIGNELFRRRYTRLNFQISIFFIAVFFYAIFSLPILFGTMGDGIFILSGIVSLVTILFFVYFLERCIPALIERSKFLLWTSIGAIYILLHIFYFGNVIPPIPLSLKDAGVYHNVSRSSGGRYRALAEKEDRIPFIPHRITIHILPSDSVYVYSAVFAPTKLQTTTIHHWQYFDESKKQWITTNLIPFSIVGGRDGGYRGYSFKVDPAPGLWRVDIETERGQLIGRVKFMVENVTESPSLNTRIL